jgi:hypothetical protein
VLDAVCMDMYFFAESSYSQPSYKSKYSVRGSVHFKLPFKIIHKYEKLYFVKNKRSSGRLKITKDI